MPGGKSNSRYLGRKSGTLYHSNIIIIITTKIGLRQIRNGHFETTAVTELTSYEVHDPCLFVVITDNHKVCLRMLHVTLGVCHRPLDLLIHPFEARAAAAVVRKVTWTVHVD